MKTTALHRNQFPTRQYFGLEKFFTPTCKTAAFSIWTKYIVDPLDMAGEDTKLAIFVCYDFS